MVGVGNGGVNSQAGTEGSRHQPLCQEHPHHAPHTPIASLQKPQKVETAAVIL